MKETINKEELLLNAFHGIQPAEVPPYFYTRLVVRMENELTEKQEPFFLLRPAFLTISLSLLLAVNIFLLIQANSGKTDSSIKQKNGATIESFSDAYDLNTTSVYE